MGGFGQVGTNLQILQNTETIAGNDVPGSSLSIEISEDRSVVANLDVDGQGSTNIDSTTETDNSFYLNESNFALGNEDMAMITAELLFSNADEPLPANIPTNSDGSSASYEHVQWGFFLGDINPDGAAVTHVHMGSWVAGEVTDDSFFERQAAGLGSATFTGHMIGNVSAGGDQYTAAGSFSNNWTFGENGNGSGELDISFDGDDYSGTANGRNASITGSFTQDGEGSRAGRIDGNFFGPEAQAQAGAFAISEQDTENNESYVASGTFAAQR